MHRSFWRQKFKYTNIATLTLSDENSSAPTTSVRHLKNEERNAQTKRTAQYIYTGLDRSRPVWRNKKRSQFVRGEENGGIVGFDPHPTCLQSQPRELHKTDEILVVTSHLLE